MNFSYDGIGYLAVTMPTQDCIKGCVCTLNEDGEAVLCNSGDMFCGVVDDVRNRMASVQLEGFVKVSYTGTTPTAGLIKLAADSIGGVAVNSNGRMYLVVSVDTDAKTIVMKL